MSGNLLLLDQPTEAETRVADAASSATGTRALPDQPEPSGDRQSAGKRSGMLSDYLQLTKPRIVVMILIVTSLAAVYAAGRELSGWMLAHLLLGTALVAASAGVANQLLEIRVDARMARTRRRPLPARRVSTAGALLLAAGLLGAGTAYLIYSSGWVPAALGLATWAIYVAIYTPLKTRSSWNTTVGAVAGALPMQMGYTAAGGSLADIEGWLLFSVLFLWQYPHFMAIAWMYRNDYGQAGLKMSPVVEPTGRSAGRQAVVGSVLLMIVLVTLVHPVQADASVRWWGMLFAAAAIGVTSRFVVASVRFARQPEDRTARSLLRASLVQLPAAMLVLVLSALI